MILERFSFSQTVFITRYLIVDMCTFTIDSHMKEESEALLRKEGTCNHANRIFLPERLRKTQYVCP
jgi:hypothetical protein